MWILIFLTLIFLVIIFLAFFGVFGKLPDNWEWVGIIFAGVGVALVIPYVLQLLLGRPTLKTRFENAVDENIRFLSVYLENPPIKNKLMRKLGIRRDTIQSLTIQFRVLEAGSSKIIIPIHNARIYADDDPTDKGRDRISLPPTYSVAASIMVVIWDNNKNKAIVPPDRLREEHIIDTGQYRVDISLITDGTPTIVSRQFVVGQKADDLCWIKTK